MNFICFLFRNWETRTIQFRFNWVSIVLCCVSLYPGKLYSVPFCSAQCKLCQSKDLELGVEDVLAAPDDTALNNERVPSTAIEQTESRVCAKSDKYSRCQFVCFWHKPCSRRDAKQKQYEMCVLEANDNNAANDSKCQPSTGMMSLWNNDWNCAVNYQWMWTNSSTWECRMRHTEQPACWPVLWIMEHVQPKLQPLNCMTDLHNQFPFFSTAIHGSFRWFPRRRFVRSWFSADQ